MVNGCAYNLDTNKKYLHVPVFKFLEPWIIESDITPGTTLIGHYSSPTCDVGHTGKRYITRYFKLSSSEPHITITYNQMFFGDYQIIDDELSYSDRYLISHLVSENAMMKKIIDELYYAPGMPGYVCSQTSFEENVKLLINNEQ
jgi:hypothetical protein